MKELEINLISIPESGSDEDYWTSSYEEIASTAENVIENVDKIRNEKLYHEECKESALVKNKARKRCLQKITRANVIAAAGRVWNANQ